MGGGGLGKNNGTSCGEWLPKKSQVFFEQPLIEELLGVILIYITGTVLLYIKLIAFTTCLFW